MKKMKALLIVLLSFAMILAIGGCGLIDNVENFKGDDSDTADPADELDEIVIEQDLEIDSEDSQNSDVTDVSDIVDVTKPDDPEENANGETKEVVLYFTAEDGKTLEGEKREIPKEEGIAKATINQLIAGPASADYSPTLPAATILEGINISNGVCTVDFSSDLISDLPDDENAQMLALYSIVNTLSQFDSVDYVRILVNGHVLDSLGGVDASQAIAPMY